MVSGPSPVDLYGCEEEDEDLTFAQDISLSGQFAQLKLRMMAQEAALKEAASGRLRRMLALNKSFTCTYAKIGAAGLVFKAQSKKSAPQRRGPALMLDIDATGATAKFQAQTFKVARCRARKKGGGKDVEDAELDPLRERFRRIGADLGTQPKQVDVEKDMDADREDGNYTSSTGTPGSDSGPKPEMVPAPDPPPLSVRFLSPRVPSDTHPHLESSFEKTCWPSQAPRAEGAQYDEMTWGQLHDPCSQRGFRKREPKAVLKTRLTAMGAAEAKRSLADATQDAGKCERAPLRGVKGLGYSSWYSGPAFCGWDTRAGAREGSEGLG